MRLFHGTDIPPEELGDTLYPPEASDLNPSHGWGHGSGCDEFGRYWGTVVWLTENCKWAARNGYYVYQAVSPSDLKLFPIKSPLDDRNTGDWITREEVKVIFIGTADQILA